MQLASIATIAPLFTAGAALIVGGVTRWTQQGVARDRIEWEGRLEIAKFDAARFETTLKHFMDAADAGNQYMAVLSDIDVTDFKQRKEYVFSILEPIGRARVESHALPDFPGVDEVKASIKRLERLVQIPENNAALLEIWDPVGIGKAIALLSKGRGWYMREVTKPETPRWRRFLLRRRRSAPAAQRVGELSSGVLASDTNG
ncbi:hypothetical protein ACFVYG_03705 [Streptomyces sp. NPDC058256]|uniref:hypothetical protein n=1 Tax=Streptomyces sp. NPDC058256 TaxID=3346408 RepID=UPI0036E8059D